MSFLPSVPFPQSQSPIADPNGNVMQPWRDFLYNLWLRLGGGTPWPTTASGLSATGTTQATALQLTAVTNVLQTVGAGSGVVLPSTSSGIAPSQPQSGQPYLVVNGGANALNVYPPVGFQIDGLGANAPYSLASGKSQIFWCISAVQFFSTQLG